MLWRFASQPVLAFGVPDPRYLLIAGSPGFLSWQNTERGIHGKQHYTVGDVTQ